MKTKHRGCGGHAWWVEDVAYPRYVYVQGMNMPCDDTIYSVYLPDNEHYLYNAHECDLFDTEVAAWETVIQRLVKKCDTIVKEAALTQSQLHTAELRRDEAKQGIRSWSTVTSSATLSGSCSSICDVTVSPSGSLRIKDGARVTRLTIQSGGTVFVSCANVESVAVYSGGNLGIKNGVIKKATIDGYAALDNAGSYDICIRDGAVVRLNSCTADNYTIGGTCIMHDTYGNIITVLDNGVLSAGSHCHVSHCYAHAGATIHRHETTQFTDLTISSGGIVQE